MIKRFKNWLAAKCRAFAFWLDGVKYSVHVVDTADPMALRLYAYQLDGIAYSVHVVDTTSPEALRKYAEKLDGAKWLPEYELKEVFIDRCDLQRLTVNFQLNEDELERYRNRLAYMDKDAADLQIDVIARRIMLDRVAKEICGSNALWDAIVMYKDNSPARHYRDLYQVALNLWVEQEDKPLTNFLGRTTNDPDDEMLPLKRK